MDDYLLPLLAPGAHPFLASTPPNESRVCVTQAQNGCSDKGVDVTSGLSQCWCAAVFKPCEDLLGKTSLGLAVHAGTRQRKSRVGALLSLRQGTRSQAYAL